MTEGVSVGISKKGFRQKQWEHVKERNYELVLSLYPVKKQIKLKCV